MKRLVIIAMIFVACNKDECLPPDFKLVGNVVTFATPGQYTIEVQGIDNPYSGFIKSGQYMAVMGKTVKVRAKSECSGWSEWQTINN